MSNKLNVLDLFCGAGGFSSGFQNADYNIVSGVDNNKSVIQTFEHNHDSNGIVADLTETSPVELEIDDDIDVVIGGPPCKGFSVANIDTGHDERNTLVDVFLDYVAYFEPTAVVMENVPAFRSEPYPTDEYDTYGALVESRLTDLGYEVSIEVLNAYQYGVAQKRRRAIVVATADGKPTHPDPLDNRRTVGDVLDGIEPDNPTYSNHRQTTLERISTIPQGGNWQDIPDDLQTMSMGENTHSNTYRRLHPAEPSVTLSNFRKSLILHPHEDRMLSIREALRIQSFDDEFEFPDETRLAEKQQMVANAVPPLLAKSIAEEIADDIASNIADTIADN